MPEGRPAIPRPLGRQVLVEAGHRCAIPTCRQVPVELAHIEPWADVQEHTIENLIALCPTCHARYDRGDIDRPAMRMYKHNLGLIVSRYSTGERRLLEAFTQQPPGAVITLNGDHRFEFMYLFRDDLIVEAHVAEPSVHIMGMKLGPHHYRLTGAGLDFIERLSGADEIF
jgi:hypothetical protein